jgi:hypothetical protein
MVIKWEAPGGGEEPGEYVVYRSEDGGPFEELDSTKRTRYVDAEIEAESVYRYRITARAGRLEGEGADSVEAGGAGLEGPSDLKVEILKQGAGLSWGPVSGATGYNIYRSSSPRRFPEAPHNPAPVLVEGFVDEALPEEDTYYVVRAVLNSSGGELFVEGFPSAAAAISPEEFVPSAPTGLAATAAEGKVLVYWDESPERWVRGFRIYRSRGEKGRFVRIGESRTPAFPDRKPKRGVLRYRVSAMGPEAEGAPSKAVRVEY